MALLKEVLGELDYCFRHMNGWSPSLSYSNGSQPTVLLGLIKTWTLPDTSLDAALTSLKGFIDTNSTQNFTTYGATPAFHSAARESRVLCKELSRILQVTREEHHGLCLVCCSKGRPGAWSCTSTHLEIG